MGVVYCFAKRETLNTTAREIPYRGVVEMIKKKKKKHLFFFFYIFFACFFLGNRADAHIVQSTLLQVENEIVDSQHNHQKQILLFGKDFSDDTDNRHQKPKEEKRRKHIENQTIILTQRTKNTQWV